MSGKIVHSDLGVTVLGGGKASRKQIGRALHRAPFLVAADKGAESALSAGIIPDVVIGDMDSARSLAERIPEGRVHRIATQDTTDFEKCLMAIDAPFVLALGVTGSRLDHSLAAMNALARHRARPVVVLSGKDIVFVAPEALRLHLPPGTRLSLFPMGASEGTGQGLRWPVDGLTFAADGRIGTSNETIAHEVQLDFPAGKMLVILPARHLDAALKALL